MYETGQPTENMRRFEAWKEDRLWRQPGFFLVLLAAFGTRLAFVFGAPFMGGDADIYTTVAENILRGCGVSLSDPGSGECVPHFGGNQLPGYPAFVAAVWFLADHANMAVRIAQAGFYLGALAWLMIAVHRLCRSRGAALAVGAVIALSPLEVAWPRYMQTETLALATTMWVLAELVHSLAEGRLRILPTAAALSAAVFIRLDGILLCVPVALTAFLVHRPWRAVWRGAAVALLLCLPLAGWTARNIAVDLPRLYPTPFTMPQNAPPPLGYAAWGRTWITEEYQRPGWGWPVNRFVYDGIQIDEKAYDNPEEKEYVQGLLEELRKHTGEPFPPEIDEAFRKLAEERAERAPFRTYVLIPLLRMKALWTNPYSSFGWPNEMPSSFSYEERLAFTRDGLMGKVRLAMKYPFQAASKAFTGLYRFALLFAFLAAVVWSCWRRKEPESPVVWIALSVVLARTVFMGFIGNVETRYTVEAVPGMEIAVVLAIHAWWQRRIQKGGETA